jgi:hypothetical protein
MAGEAFVKIGVKGVLWPIHMAGEAAVAAAAVLVGWLF